MPPCFFLAVLSFILGARETVPAAATTTPDANKPNKISKHQSQSHPHPQPFRRPSTAEPFAEPSARSAQDPPAAPATVSRSEDEPSLNDPQTRKRSSSRPISLLQAYQPPRMDIGEDTIPELQPIFTFLNAHGNKLFQEGYFLKLDDQNTRACPPTSPSGSLHPVLPRPRLGSCVSRCMR